jgi:hypothetical protein
MKKRKKWLNWRLVALMTTVLSVVIYFTNAGTMNFFVNGKQVANNQGQPFVQSGVTYVPLQPAIQGMGGSYSYNSRTKTATFKARGSKSAMTITNGATVAKSGKLGIPLRSKVVNKRKVNDNRKAQIYRNIFYVPVDFLQTTFGYPVTIKKSGNTTTVYVGAVPRPKPAPKPAPKPTPKPAPKPAPKPTPKPAPKPAPKPITKSSIVSFDRNAVMNKLTSNGFFRMNTYYATLNPFNPGGSGYTAVSLGLSDESNMVLEILAWTDPDMPEMNIIPGKVKLALQTMIPSGSDQIYNIVSQTAVSGRHSELNKVFTYDGLKTKVTFQGGSRPAVRVIFSK